MKLFIDNNNGQGGIDYTAASLRSKPLSIVRERGKWAECHGALDCVGNGFASPAERARVLVTDAADRALFQGFLCWNTEGTTFGAAVPAAEKEPAFFALESAWLTEPTPTNELVPSTAVMHSLPLQDVTLKFDKAEGSAAEDLAMDVTVSGAAEPRTYITELFRGDGTTQTFSLAHGPFRPSSSGTLLNERFDDAALDTSVWSKSDAGSYLDLGAGGLNFAGGTGVDGATVLQAVELVEMGGTLTAQATGLSLASGSDGVLLGFYNGVVRQALCIAGVRVRGAAGVTEMVALINGVEQSEVYAFAPGHTYTARVRFHCDEIVRVGTPFRAAVNGTPQEFVANPPAALLHVVVEVIDTGFASSTIPTILYDGVLASSPSQCVFAVVNSISLAGNIGTVTLLQQGSAWIVSTANDGTVLTRREGTAEDGADFTLSSIGTIKFATGLTPAPGELLTVTYRRSARSVARLKDPGADEIRISLALPGVPAWIGHVAGPVPRTSAECAAAANALLALANGSATGKSGAVEWIREGAVGFDVLPGDTLTVTTDAAPTVLPVRAVTVTDMNCSPEILRYRAEFAQSRAESLDFTVGKNLAPGTPQTVEVALDWSSLPSSLAALQVTSATVDTLTLDAGLDAISGGGFEVRRSEASFGSASSADLVLRSPARGFSIPRQAFAERFFVRMYDGSSPPQYSPLSHAVLTNLPLT